MRPFHSTRVHSTRVGNRRLKPAARRAIAGPFVNFCAAQCDRFDKRSSLCDKRLKALITNGFVPFAKVNSPGHYFRTQIATRFPPGRDCLTPSYLLISAVVFFLYFSKFNTARHFRDTLFLISRSHHDRYRGKKYSSYGSLNL